MILRLKDIITHSYDTKLTGEDGKDATANWGTRLSLKEKLFREDPRDNLTRGLGNRSNPKKDSIGIDILGWCNNRLEKGGEDESILILPMVKLIREASRWSTRKESYTCQRGKQSSLRKVYTFSTVCRAQTNGCGNTVDGCPVDRGVQRSGDRPMVAYTQYRGDDPNTWGIHPL